MGKRRLVTGYCGLKWTGKLLTYLRRYGEKTPEEIRKYFQNVYHNIPCYVISDRVTQTICYLEKQERVLVYRFLYMRGIDKIAFNWDTFLNDDSMQVKPKYK